MPAEVADDSVYLAAGVGISQCLMLRLSKCPNTLAASNRAEHHQPTEPCLDAKAAPWQFPSKA